MTTPNAEPIPVSEALKLVEMAIEDCDKATPEWGEGWLERRLNKPDVSFLILSSAVMRPLIELVKNAVVHAVYNDEVKRGDWIYPPLAALRDHFDRVRPDWRVSK